MTEPLFRGVGVALVTLFEDDGSLDSKATADLASRLVDSGVQSVVVSGSTGEASALSAEERFELLSAIVASVGSTVPVIAGAGATSLRQALRFTADAIDAGASGILALSPPGNADLARYYGGLAAVVGDLPLLAYHFPATSAPGIPLPVLRSLPVSGVKDSSGEAERLLETVTTWDAHVYTGSSALLSFAGPIGCTGAILQLANAEPEDCIAAFSGDADAQRRIAPAHRASKANFPGGIKELTAKRFGTSMVARLG